MFALGEREGSVEGWGFTKEGVLFLSAGMLFTPVFKRLGTKGQTLEVHRPGDPSPSHETLRSDKNKKQ